MIVVLVVFGILCVVIAFIVCLIFGMATGNLIGVRAKFIRENGFIKTKTFNVPAIKEKVNNVSKKYFIKLGSNKVPIEKSEVKKAEKDGYEILIE